MTIKKSAISCHINTILFDMVGVLLFQKDTHKPRTINEINADNIEKLYNHVDDLLLIKDVKKKLYLTDKQIEDAFPYIPEKFEKFNELWEMLPKLKKYFRLGIVNNGNHIAWKYWRQRFDYSIFEFFVNSAQEKTKKPYPELYLIACKKLGVDPKNCLFMDDNKENVETARKLGMKVLWWDKNRGKQKNLKLFLDIISRFI